MEFLCERNLKNQQLSEKTTSVTGQGDQTLPKSMLF